MLIALVLAAATPADGTAPPDCSFDQAAMLALAPGAFDQDLAGGWRPLAERGCKREAADLLAAYSALPKAAGNTTIVWHEAQLRAELGQTAQAITLMQRSYKPNDGTDPGYWNAYVDGTLAFLRHDRTALEHARTALLAIPLPEALAANVKEGRYHFVTEGGQAVDMPWPPNLDRLDGFLRCFDKPYLQAYNSEECLDPTAR